MPGCATCWSTCRWPRPPLTTKHCCRGTADRSIVTDQQPCWKVGFMERIRCESEVRPEHRVRPGAKAEPSQDTESALFAPGAGAPTVRGESRFCCRSTATVRKRSPARTPSPLHSHPGRVLLQGRGCAVTAGG